MQQGVQLLEDIGRLLTRSHDLAETLENVVRLVGRWTRASACSIYLVDRTDGSLVLRATRGLNPQSVGQVRLAPGKGIAGAALEARRAIAVEDARQDPRVVANPDSGEQRFRGLLAVPLLVRDLPIGALTVRTAEIRPFPREEVELLEMIAAQVGSIVLNASLLDRAGREGTPTPLPALESPEPWAPGTVLHAIPISSGIARGPVYHLPPPPDLESLRYRPSGSPRSEWSALRGALGETIRQLSDLRAAVGERFGEEFADVFTTHIMILEDQGFRTKLEEHVGREGNALRALSDVTREYTAVFAATRDATIRERAADIEDVTQRVAAELLGVREHNPPLGDGVVVVADRIAPSEFVRLETEKIAGLVFAHGGPTAHASIFARSLEIPAVSGFSDGVGRFANAREVIVDGLEGRVVVDPSVEQRAEFAEQSARLDRSMHRLDEYRGRPTTTRDGREIRLSANIGGLYDLDGAERCGVLRVGMLRTEILALAARGFPDEDEQCRIYQRIGERVAPESVTVRLFDLGGDKTLPGGDYEPNPQLGLRSIRLLLAREPVLRGQLRAILRANVQHNLRIMVPMVTSVDELEAVRAIADEVAADLGVARPALGIMIETPAAVGLARHLAERADFFSIGSNDLVQYTLAADRENERVARSYDTYHPVVLAQIRATVDAAEEAGIPCSLCGEMAGSPAAVPILVGLGLTELSMTPALALLAAQLVRAVHWSAVRELADELIALPRSRDVRVRTIEAYESMGLLRDRDLGGVLQRILRRVDTRKDPV